VGHSGRIKHTSENPEDNGVYVYLIVLIALPPIQRKNHSRRLESPLHKPGSNVNNTVMGTKPWKVSAPPPGALSCGAIALY